MRRFRQFFQNLKIRRKIQLFSAVLVLLFIYILYPRLADVFLRARTSAPAQTEAVGAEETVRRNGLDQSGISDVEWQEQPITVVPNDYQE